MHHLKSLVSKQPSQLHPVRVALEAFGDIAVDLVIAVKGDAPESGPDFQNPVLQPLRHMRGRARKIKKGGGAAGPQDPVYFIQRALQIGGVAPTRFSSPRCSRWW